MSSFTASKTTPNQSVKSGLTAEMFRGDVKILEHCDSKGIIITLVTSPGGRIFFNEKNPDTQDIFADLTLSTAQSFGMELDETSNDGTLHHVQDHDGLVLLHDQAGAAGFASGIFKKEGLLYLHGIAIAPRAKGRGSARPMVNALRQAGGMQDITFTTQNPVMFCLLRSLCSSTYPNPEQNMPGHLRAQAIALMQGRPGSLDPTTGIVHNLYGRCLYPKLPESGDSAVNAWFAKALEVSDGRTRSAFLFIGQGSG